MRSGRLNVSTATPLSVTSHSTGSGALTGTTSSSVAPSSMYAHTVHLSVVPSAIARRPSRTDQPEPPICLANLRLRLLRQLGLGRPGLRVVAHRQTQHRRRVLERGTPVREVVRTTGIAGEPRGDVDAELIQPRFDGVVHRLHQL